MKTTNSNITKPKTARAKNSIKKIFTICIHCSKKIIGIAKLSGLAFVCPYCGKPTGNGTPGTGYRWGKANNLDFSSTANKGITKGTIKKSIKKSTIKKFPKK